MGWSVGLWWHWSTVAVPYRAVVCWCVMRGGEVPAAAGRSDWRVSLWWSVAGEALWVLVRLIVRAVVAHVAWLANEPRTCTGPISAAQT